MKDQTHYEQWARRWYRLGGFSLFVFTAAFFGQEELNELLPGLAAEIGLLAFIGMVFGITLGVANKLQENKLAKQG